MDRKPVRGFLTKYALTNGILEIDHAELLGPDDKYVSYESNGMHDLAQYGREFFATREEAEEEAKAMARRRISGLEKQIAKLRKLAETPKWYGKEPTP